jgi:hypothetical protein
MMMRILVEFRTDRPSDTECNLSENTSSYSRSQTELRAPGQLSHSLDFVFLDWFKAPRKRLRASIINFRKRWSTLVVVNRAGYFFSRGYEFLKSLQ